MPTITTPQSTAFASALVAWMDRESLPVGRAAGFLGVARSELASWLDGSCEADRDDVCMALMRIAGGK